MEQIFTRIAGTGSYLPSRIVPNSEIATKIDTSDAWIRSMTGIVQRHIAGDGESTTDMALVASQRALKGAGINSRELELIVVATITPDLVFPSTAAMLQARLGAPQVGAFDLSAACSGFLYAMAVVDGLITSGKCRAALVVGAETMSRLLDWNERSTCVLFGDGAGAVVLTPSGRPGIRSIHLHADGSSPDVLRAPSKYSQYLHMDGGTVYKFAVRGLVEGGREALDANQMGPDDVDWVIPHQANLRIMEAFAKKLNVPQENLIVTVDRHANTSAASIPLALDAAVSQNWMKTGNEVLLVSVGGGFTWASSLVRWG